ncbi:hypothetical protein [Pedobacter aquatilis]|uniref:hypothetical protein n=1 Tax=Pedobacter aquatilis TaxID=351343 RepID=UPI00292DA2A2|nr:hypothetical protein [Pedobacter aquatilis]
MKSLYLALIVTLFFNSGCEKKVNPINQTVDFIGERSKIVGESTFTITNIVDNRCAPHELCEVAGKANVSVKVQTGFDIRIFSLCAGNCDDIGATDNVTFTIDNAKYWIKLKSVSPSNSTELTLPQTVTLEITKG